MITIFSEDQVQGRVEVLAEKISNEYLEDESVVIGNLTGSVYFVTDLTKKIKKKIFIDFIGINSYCGTKQKTISLSKDIFHHIKNRIFGHKVLIVDDILDSGKTIKQLINQIETYKPIEIKTCFLLDKELSAFKADYVGFKIKNEFVVGYGLDYKDKYRNLPSVSVLEKEDIDDY